MNPVKISGCIITFNEERNIERCIRSMLPICDEIIVIDSYSTDQTESICNNLGVRFIKQEFLGHVAQKNFAVSKAKFDWILSLDADEVVSEALSASLEKTKIKPNHKAYSMNRISFYAGKWIHHSGWYPDNKVRFWDKNYGKWGGQNPHDKVILSTEITSKKLDGDLLHYSYNSIGHHVQQINKYTDISSDELVKVNYKVNVLVDIVLNPIYAFFKYYVLKKGFLDGYHGFVISFLTGFGKFLKYVKVREKSN